MADIVPYLLRIEAVNLSTFIGDSEDLSTIRGAGMLVLGLHEFLTGWSYEDTPRFCDPKLFRVVACERPKSAREAQFFWQTGQTSETEIELTLVSAGASIVVYSFQSSDELANTLRNDADHWLRTHKFLRHATFSIAIHGRDHSVSFARASEAVLQRVRRRQLRAPNVAIGPLQTKIGNPAETSRFCDIDGKRPGTESLKNQPPEDTKTSDTKTSYTKTSYTKTSYAKAADKNYASPATDVRRAYGRDTKIRVYHMIGGLRDDECVGKFTPAWEFNDIADRGATRRVDGDFKTLNGTDPWHRLSGKMAVVYIDGNQFGKQIRRSATTEMEYRDIDEKMLVRRRELMSALIERMKKPIEPIKEPNRPYWRFKPQTWEQEQSEHYRIETLMWGGDELIWVVPAWCALETVSFFFEQTKDWTLKDNRLDPKLTHAVGMVLCSHKSPIRSVVKLAKVLADSAKDCNRKSPQAAVHGDGDLPFYNQPKSNVMAYQVLESFDHIGNDFADARRRHRFPCMSDHEAILSVDDLASLISYINQLRVCGFPRSRLYEIAQLPQRTAEPQANSAQTNEVSHPLRVLLDRIKDTTPSIAAALRSETLAWPKESARWYHVMELWDYLGSSDMQII